MILREEVPERGQYDIIVAGGGVAGVAAAVSAARLGRKVLLIEKSMKLGGLATLGLINLFVPMCNGRGKQIIFGMAQEFLELSLRYGYGDLPKEFQNGRIPEKTLAAYRDRGQLPPRYMVKFSPEIFALTLTELCQKEGVHLLFDSVLSKPVMDPDRPGILSGVVVENKSGREYYSAQMFVDATGDGDLLFRAGVPTKARGNYHIYVGFGITLDSCKRAAELGDIGLATESFRGGNASLYGHNQPDGMPLYSGTSSESVNRYLITNQLEMLDKIKGDDRKSRDITTLPGMAQFRTTRCIDGDYVLKESDTYRHFADSVGAICDFDRRDYLFEIPFGALVKHGYDNLITAGRSAAGEGYAWDVLRVIPPAILSGQAAGVACAHALDEKRPIWDVDISRLQAELEREKVLIHFADEDVPEVSLDIHENND